MSWRDRLKTASWAGVEFFVESHDFTTGRRAASHEFPQRDAPLLEDLGRAARQFRVRGYILGEDYDLARDQLIKASEQRSPSFPFKVGRTLSHPYLGLLQVYLEALVVRENSRVGGLCRVELVFLEAPETVLPKKSVAVEGAVDDAATALEDAGEASALEDVTGSGAPSEVYDATDSALVTLGKKLETLKVFDGPIADVAAFSAEVDFLLSQASSLATNPAAMVVAVRSALESILASAGSFLGAFEAYRVLFGFQITGATGASATAAKSGANTQAVVDLARQFAVSGASRAAARVSWRSREDATTARDQLVGELDALLECEDATVCSAVPALTAAVMSGIPDPTQDFPRALSVTLTDWEPGLVTAYRLLGDATQGDDIAHRNREPRMGFLPAATPLEVVVP